MLKKEKRKKETVAVGEHGPVARSDRLPNWFCVYSALLTQNFVHADLGLIRFHRIGLYSDRN
jgi:hypothetical protein